jgi:hypothetical protein
MWASVAYGLLMQGGGAQLNGVPITVSGCDQMSHALLVTEVGVTRDPDTFRAVFSRIESLAKVGGWYSTMQLTTE